MERLEEASKSLKKALELDQGDGETWNNLGGVLRRLGMINAHNKYDWDTLREARDSYKMAVELNQYDIYALGNVAKLDLMLSKIEASCKTAALDYFDTLRHLCPIQLKKSPNDYWIRFDLADAHLLSGNVSEGHHLYKEAMQKVPAAYRSSTFSSVISPLQNILFLDVVEEPINNVIKQLIEELTKASSQNIATTDGK